ncbi:MAG: HAD-IA family hydrolase [Halobacteriales archaeon]
MEGTLVSGVGNGAAFVEAARAALADVVGFRPYPGTLNLEGVESVEALPKRTLDDDLGDPHCEGVHLRPCAVGGVRSTVIRPLVPGYPPEKLELLAPVALRDLFGWTDGAAVSLSGPAEAWTPDGPTVAAGGLDAFAAVAFDLDGTLVDLAVDWTAVHDEIEARFGADLDKAVDAYSENELFDLAVDRGFYDELLGLLEAHELPGAAEGVGLAALEALDRLSVPVGVCTANASRAAERALDRFGVAGSVDAVVGRETVRPGKPEPAPLVETFDRLGVDPGNAVYVGDQPGDAEAAAAAGASFLPVGRLEPDG